ncbi:hypothetical protein HRbin08_01968 [bacterium HR08]|nr:hypothetical protein HRbin08_01968 [bacterium HR08]
MRAEILQRPLPAEIVHNEEAAAQQVFPQALDLPIAQIHEPHLAQIGERIPEQSRVVKTEDHLVGIYPHQAHLTQDPHQMASTARIIVRPRRHGSEERAHGVPLECLRGEPPSVLEACECEPIRGRVRIRTRQRRAPRRGPPHEQTDHAPDDPEARAKRTSGSPWGAHSTIPPPHLHLPPLHFSTSFSRSASAFSNPGAISSARRISRRASSGAPFATRARAS